MRISEKINFKIYIHLSLIILITGYFLARNKEELMAIGLIYIASCGNQWLLVKSVREMSQRAASGAPVDDRKMFFLMMGKLGLIIAALSVGVHVMGNRVIIPVLIYVFQIAVMYLSFR